MPLAKIMISSAKMAGCYPWRHKFWDSGPKILGLGAIILGLGAKNFGTGGQKFWDNVPKILGLGAINFGTRGQKFWDSGPKILGLGVAILGVAQIHAQTEKNESSAEKKFDAWYNS